MFLDRCMLLLFVFLYRFFLSSGFFIQKIYFTLFKHLSIKNIYIKSLKVIYDKSNFVYSWFYNSLALMTQALANLWATFRKTKLLNLCRVYAKTSYGLYISISHACCPTTGYVCPRLSYSIKLRIHYAWL